MKPKKLQDTIGFSFQEIPLEEARSAVLAGKGHYAEVIEHLLIKLPSVTGGYAFGLPNGDEVDEMVRRAICKQTNSALNRAGLSWKVTYSGNRKLFICIPKSARKQKPSNVEPPSRPPHRNKYYYLTPEGKALKESIRKRWRLGASCQEIQREFNLTKSRVDYFCYQAFKGEKGADVKKSGGGK